jgi:hypothetical protein
MPGQLGGRRGEGRDLLVLVIICFLGLGQDLIRPSPEPGGSVSRLSKCLLITSMPGGAVGYESETRIFTRLAER